MTLWALALVLHEVILDSFEQSNCLKRCDGFEIVIIKVVFFNPFSQADQNRLYMCKQCRLRTVSSRSILFTILFLSLDENPYL